MTYIEELESAVLKIHGCEATHVETISVKEIYLGKPVWSGEVEVFDLAQKLSGGAWKRAAHLDLLSKWLAQAAFGERRRLAKRRQ